MAEERIQRRLAAILAADVVGDSWLMGEDATAGRAGGRSDYSGAARARACGRMEGCSWSVNCEH